MTIQNDREKLLATLTTKELVLEVLRNGKITTNEALLKINALSRLEGKKTSIRTRIGEYLDEDDILFIPYLLTLLVIIADELKLLVRNDAYVQENKKEITKDKSTMYAILIKSINSIKKNSKGLENEIRGIELLGSEDLGIPSDEKKSTPLS